MRELFAYGTLLGEFDLLAMTSDGWSGLALLDIESGFLLAALPPGAFIALGLLVATYRYVSERRTGQD